MAKEVGHLEFFLSTESDKVREVYNSDKNTPKDQATNAPLKST